MAAEKRNIETTQNTKTFQIADLILVAVLLAAGQVLKMTLGTALSSIGVKPNFIIAMYCLAILLIRPTLLQALIIGLLAGAINQINPATPWLNFISEPLGAIAMYLLIKIPLKIRKFDLSPIVSTFLATVVSGGSFVACRYLFMGANVADLPANLVVVFGTATVNAIIVEALYFPLRKMLSKR
ncbi:MAG: hypothetical protein IKP40_12315 [Clostridia bacterium]|nr:hypothetical protein [Clostridia bacterium]